MPVPPSRDEILAKYRDVIEAEDFEILAANELPTPSQLQSEGACLEKLGPLGDCVIWLKKKLHGPIVVIALFGSFMSGIEYISN